MCCVFFFENSLRPPPMLPMLFDMTSRTISIKFTKDLSKRVGHIAIIGSRALDIKQLRPSNHCGMLAVEYLSRNARFRAQRSV